MWNLTRLCVKTQFYDLFLYVMQKKKKIKINVLTRRRSLTKPVSVCKPSIKVKYFWLTIMFSFAVRLFCRSSIYSEEIHHLKCLAHAVKSTDRGRRWNRRDAQKLPFMPFGNNVDAATNLLR